MGGGGLEGSGSTSGGSSGGASSSSSTPDHGRLLAAVAQHCSSTLVSLHIDGIRDWKAEALEPQLLALTSLQELRLTAVGAVACCLVCVPAGGPGLTPAARCAVTAAIAYLTALQQ